jgi:hypothetical protein
MKLPATIAIAGKWEDSVKSPSAASRQLQVFPLDYLAVTGRL